jgi:hypothetical protein
MYYAISVPGAVDGNARGFSSLAAIYSPLKATC